MKKREIIKIIEDFRKEDCRCKGRLICLRCSILDELKERIERRF